MTTQAMTSVTPATTTRQPPEVIVAMLPGGMVGHCDVEANLVLLDARLSPAARRVTLEHELVHWERGDTCVLNRHLYAAQERQVDRIVARRLLPLSALEDAARWAMSIPEACDMLDVPEETLWRRVRELSEHERQRLADLISHTEGTA